MSKQKNRNPWRRGNQKMLPRFVEHYCEKVAESSDPALAVWNGINPWRFLNEPQRKHPAVGIVWVEPAFKGRPAKVYFAIDQKNIVIRLTGTPGWNPYSRPETLLTPPVMGAMKPSQAAKLEWRYLDPAEVSK